MTEFVAELGLVFLLFFLGLEFSLGRLRGSGRHVGLGGAVDFAVNAGLGLVVGLAAFGPTWPGFVLAACIYVSSSAIAVKGLIDFRRLGDDETDLVLAILVVEDLAVALMLGFAATGGGGVSDSLVVVATALGFVTAGLAVSRWLAGRSTGCSTGCRSSSSCSRSSASSSAWRRSRRSSGSPRRSAPCSRHRPVGDVGARADRGALLRLPRHLRRALLLRLRLSIDLSAFGQVGWIIALAVVVTVVGKLTRAGSAAWLGGFTRRQGLNVGAALVAHGEFTVILATLASGNTVIAAADRSDLTAFAGVYVLITATIGVILMKESKQLGRLLFTRRAGARLAGES